MLLHIQLMRLIGGDEMKRLFDHAGKVANADTFEQAIKKVSNGIKKQTNQATARFKLFQQMPQAGQCFAEWYTKAKEQAYRCEPPTTLVNALRKRLNAMMRAVQPFQGFSSLQSTGERQNISRKGGREQTRAVTEEAEIETDSEGMGRVLESNTEGVRALQGNKAKSKTATISITALDHGTASHPSNIKLLIDSGVSKTLLSEADWKKIKPLKGKPLKGNPKLRLKKNKTNFTPFRTNMKLPPSEAGQNAS